ncbi:phage tail protein [Salinivibrio proteolyticus]|nr:phage tail protein [Salinivibrio proteolyticus]
MAGLSSRMWVDTDFIKRLPNLPSDVQKAAQIAVRKTNQWFRHITMTELGYELAIDNKAALRSRFKVYRQGGVRARLWVGIRDIGVHRLGKPVQQKEGVAVGERFFEKAFISPMNSSELLVFRRTGKHRSQIEMVQLDIADEAEEIIGSYQADLNRKFEEIFTREFHRLYST